MEQLECDLRDHLISSLQDNPRLDLDGLMNIGSSFVANDMLAGGYAQRVAVMAPETEMSPSQEAAAETGTEPTAAADKKQNSAARAQTYSPGVQETLTPHSQNVVDLLKQMSGMAFKVTSGQRDMPGQVRAMVNYPFAQGTADVTYKKNPTALKLYAWYKGMHKGGLSNEQISDVFVNVLNLDKKLGAQFAASMPHMAGSPDTYQAIDIGPNSIDRKRWVEFKNILNQLHDAGVLRKPALVPAEIADKHNKDDSSFHFEVNQHLTPEQQRAYDQLNIDTYLK